MLGSICGQQQQLLCAAKPPATKQFVSHSCKYAHSMCTAPDDAAISFVCVSCAAPPPPPPRPQNPLVWSTAIAVLLSALGSAALLDPSSPLALKHLAFLEALLGWFAQTTAPLTLFTTGLWMYSNQQQQRQQEQQRQQRQPAPHSNGLVGDHHSSVSASAPSFGSRDVAWGDVATQLLLRATVAPLWMVVVCRAMGFRGDLGHALVILALLPVAQTAFVVCKQAETGMAAVSTMLVASLFAMLPQLMIVLALLERLGVLAPTDV